MIGNPQIWYVGYCYPNPMTPYPQDSPLNFQGQSGAPQDVQGVLSFDSREEAQRYYDSDSSPYKVGPFRRM